MTRESRKPPVVSILTAGIGSRVGALTKHLNKALLPVDNKAVISKIIEKFPQDTRFVIAVGYKAEQIKSYLSMAHPETVVDYCTVDNFQGTGSGPGYSLLCCESKLQEPFFFVSCDTLWEEELPMSSDRDWFAVARVPSDESPSYCNFLIENETVTEIHDKKKVIGDSYRAFTGLCYIKNVKEFWAALKKPTLINNEHQISAGIHALVSGFKPGAVDITWHDSGTEEKYRKLGSQYEDYNFSKPEEAIYIVPPRVIKYFANEKITENRVARAKQKPGVFPEILSSQSGFYCYSFVQGHTLYEYCDPKIFKNFLYWAEKNLWDSVSVPEQSMQKLCSKFYKDKTLERINAYKKKYPGETDLGIVNGQPVPSLDQLLPKVPWHILEAGIPVIFHGDLQFDNILYNPAQKNFTLLDWRQDFAGEVQFGDLYYDLAKLHGGLILNYDYIKKNLFTFKENEGEISYDFGQRMRMTNYREILFDFVSERNLSSQKITLLTAIIYLNMSPLHSHPFDKMLHAMGRLYLAEYIAK